MLPMLADSRTPEVALDPEVLDEVIAEVDSRMSKALLMGDPNIAFSFIRDFSSWSLAKGIGSAKLLHQTWTEWPKFMAAGVDEEWENYAPGASGLSLEQCRKYRDLVQDVYENPNVPEFAKKALLSKSLDGQLRVRAAAKAGDLTDDDWERIADAVTSQEIGQIVRDRRGAATSSESRIIIVVGRDGVVKAKQGTAGKYVTIGTLRLSRTDTEGDDYEHRIRAIAIERIVRSAGILEQ